METVFLRRVCMTEHATQGVVVHDGKILCVSIERPWLDNKPNVSCIPGIPWTDDMLEETVNSPFSGAIYPVLRQDSPKFGPRTWHVQDVPGRSHIIFGHIRNWASDVEGCMAFGESFQLKRDGVSAMVESSTFAVSEFKAYTRDWDEFRLVVTDV